MLLRPPVPHLPVLLDPATLDFKKSGACCCKWPRASVSGGGGNLLRVHCLLLGRLRVYLYKEFEVVRMRYQVNQGATLTAPSEWCVGDQDPSCKNQKSALLTAAGECIEKVVAWAVKGGGRRFMPLGNSYEVVTFDFAVNDGVRGSMVKLAGTALLVDAPIMDEQVCPSFFLVVSSVHR